MSTRKLIAFAAALLITAANLYGIASYTNAGAHSVLRHNQATLGTIKTLPTIHVTPTPEQLREIRRLDGVKGAASRGPVMMPYYSFAADEVGA